MNYTKEQIEKIADEYANQFMDGRDHFYGFVAGFEKALKLFTSMQSSINMNNYVVKPEDLTGDIKDFPIELVQWMVDQQVKQGNKADVGVFQDASYTSFLNRGIDWIRTELGVDVCSEIINKKNFDLFFKHFPKQEYKHFGLPELKAVEMEVSDDGVEWYKAFIVGVLNGKHIAVGGSIWHYCRPIQQPVKLTRAEIAEKFGVSKDFILED